MKKGELPTLEALVTISGKNIYANSREITLKKSTTNPDLTNVFYNNDLNNDGDKAIPIDFSILDNTTLSGSKDYDLSTYTIYGGGIAEINRGTNVTMAGGKVQDIYGGGNNAAVNNNTSVRMEGGTARNVYGGGNGANATVTGNTSVTMIRGTVANFYGGGNAAATVTGNTLLQIWGELNPGAGGVDKITITGSIFGGGNASAVTGNSEVIILRLEEGEIAGDVVGGGNGATVGGTATVNVSSGIINGNVYCGGIGANSAVAGVKTLKVSGPERLGTAAVVDGGGAITTPATGIIINNAVGDTTANPVTNGADSFEIKGSVYDGRGNIKIVLPEGYRFGTVATPITVDILTVSPFSLVGAGATGKKLKFNTGKTQMDVVPNEYTVTYDGNGNTSPVGTIPPAITTREIIESLAVKGDLAKTDYKFTGWNTRADGYGDAYAAGAKYDKMNDMTLYAQWEELGTISINVAAQNKMYNGKPQEFVISDKKLTTRLGVVVDPTPDMPLTIMYKKSTDADTAYSATAPTNVGTYSVKITRAEDQVIESKAFSKVLQLTIDPKPLSADMLNINQAGGTYNGSAFTTNVVVTDGTPSIIQTTDFAVTWKYAPKVGAAVDPYDSAAAGAFTNAGTYTATITATPTGNYSGSAEQSFTIAQATPIVTYTIAPKDYGTIAYVSGALSIIPETSEIKGIGTTKLTDGTLAVTVKNPTASATSKLNAKNYATIYTYTVGSTNANNYGNIAATEVADSLIVNKIAIDRPAVWSGDLTFNTQLQQSGITKGASGTGYTVSGAISGTNAGEYTATADLEPNYKWKTGPNDTASHAIKWEIKKKNLSEVTIADIAAVTYKAEAYMPEPKVSWTPAGVPEVTLLYMTDFSFIYENTTDASATAKVKITAVANSNYMGENSKMFTINQATNAWKTKLALSKATWTYGDAAATIATAPTANFGTPEIKYYKVGDTTALTGMPTTVGKYEAKATVGGTTNYTGLEAVPADVVTFEITKKAATVATNAATKNYGAENPTWGVTLSGFVASDNVTAADFDITSSATKFSPIGTYDIAVSGKTAETKLSNYEITYNTTNKLEITAKPITITIEDKTIVFGATPAELTWKDGGNAIEKSNGTTPDDLKIVLTKAAGTDVGAYNITGTYTNTNYTVTFKNTDNTQEYGVYNITRKGVAKPTKAATALTYSGAELTGIDGVASGKGYTIAGDYKATNVKTPGDYSATFTLDTNHCWTTDSTGETTAVTITWNITPLEATLLWAAPANLVYDGKAKAPTVTVTNLVKQGDVIDTCTVTVELTSGGNTNVSETVEPFIFTASALGNPNYTLPTEKGSPSYIITPQPLTNIKVEKEFAEGEVAFSLKLSDKNCTGFIVGDDLTIKFNTSEANKGTYTGAKIIGLNRSGADIANYSFTEADITAKITGKKLPEITLTATENTYNGGAQATTPSITGTIEFGFTWEYAADNKTFTAVTGEPAFINAGTYRVTATGTGNYAESTQVADYVIKKKTVALVWSTLTPEELAYDGKAKVLTANVDPSLVSQGAIKDICTVTVKLTAEGTNINVGDFTFKAETLSNNNYDLPANCVSTTCKITQATNNAWTTTPPLKIDNIYEGDVANPIATPKFGEVVYTYYKDDGGKQGAEIGTTAPKEIGKYWVTAQVKNHTNYNDVAETEAVSFEITQRPAGGDVGSISSEDIFWAGISSDLKYKSEPDVTKNCDYDRIPKNVLLELQGVDKTLTLNMNGETIVITSKEIKDLTFDKAAYSIVELKAMLETPEIIPTPTPTPTEKPTEPTEPTEKKCWLCGVCPMFLGVCLWIWLAIAVALVAVVVIIVVKKKKKGDDKTKKE